MASASWREVVSAAAVADCLAALVVARGWEAPAHHWDFATITLCGLVAALERSKRAWSTTKVRSPTCRVDRAERALMR